MNITKEEIIKFRETMKNIEKVEVGTDTIEMFYKLSQRAIKLCLELNTKYHSPQEIVKIFSEITCNEIDESFRMFPPFNTDCGVNITVGKKVFINSGCKFQDQAGIYIGDNTFIGHNLVIATLNHDENPLTRPNMTPKPVRIGKDVWIGSNVTILPGVTIGDGSIIGAGSVVTKDVPENVVAVGSPAKVLRPINS